MLGLTFSHRPLCFPVVYSQFSSQRVLVIHESDCHSLPCCQHFEGFPISLRVNAKVLAGPSSPLWSAACNLPSNLFFTSSSSPGHRMLLPQASTLAVSSLWNACLHVGQPGLVLTRMLLCQWCLTWRSTLHSEQLSQYFTPALTLLILLPLLYIFLYPRIYQCLTQFLIYWYTEFIVYWL